MLRLRHAFTIAVVLAAALACARPTPPVGRWEGVYEDAGLIVVVRLEISPNGEIKVSAPNAVTENETLNPTDRAELRGRLQQGLAASWPSVMPLPLEFDGKVFHKPGGVAPQLEWDGRQMTMIYYAGNRSSVHVPLSPVDSFAS